MSGHPELRVLVDGLRDEAWDVCSVPEDVREAVRETGCSLHWWESNLTNIMAVVKPENTSYLVVGS